MQETILAVQANAELEHSSAAVSLLDLPVAKLQIMLAGDVIRDQRLDRSLLEPQLAQNADGLWALTVLRQGEYRQFDVPYIGSEIVLAEAELGLVVVLVSFHGASAEKYGKRGYFTQKGQFYRFFRQESTGDWHCVAWRSTTICARWSSRRCKNTDQPGRGFLESSRPSGNHQPNPSR